MVSGSDRVETILHAINRKGGLVEGGKEGVHGELVLGVGVGVENDYREAFTGNGYRGCKIGCFKFSKAPPFATHKHSIMEYTPQTVAHYVLCADCGMFHALPSKPLFSHSAFLYRNPHRAQLWSVHSPKETPPSHRANPFGYTANLCIACLRNTSVPFSTLAPSAIV